MVAEEDHKLRVLFLDQLAVAPVVGFDHDSGLICRHAGETLVVQWRLNDHVMMAIARHRQLHALPVPPCWLARAERWKLVRDHPG
jgi:hypothetical protein